MRTSRPHSRREASRLLMWLALAAVLAVPVATTGTGAAQSGEEEIQVEVNECGEEGCESTVQSAEPEPSATPRPAPTVAPAPTAAPPRGGEVHRLSLKNGKGSVTTEAGTVEEAVRVDAPKRDRDKDS